MLGSKESMGFSIADRESLGVLTDKLCAVGVCPSELSFCALRLFKQTFEVERPLMPLGGEGDRESTCPSIAELLPAFLAWIKYNNKLARNSMTDHDPTSFLSGNNVQIATSLGELT
jgi:hypothetical protein